MLKKCQNLALGLCFILGFSVNSFSQAPMVVTANVPAQDLVGTLTGSGITTLNANLNCPSTANGLFEVTGINTLGIDSGIVLSTGYVDFAPTVGSVVGPNDGVISGPTAPTNGANNDPDLQSLVPGRSIRDVCYLEFDFVPIGDSINFDFVFASSEYWDFSCSSYNDVFGFFISGPGITGTQNIALIPGTNIPIMVNSTTNGPSPGQSLSNCSSIGPGSPFSQYYNDNRNGPTISFGGYTDVFTAKAAVQACDTYHLKLAIADVGDDILDSGVFLKAGSLSSIGINSTVEGTYGANQNNDHCVRGCKSAYVTLNREAPINQDTHIDIVFGGDAINGLDYETIAPIATIPAGTTEAVIEVKPLLASAPTGPKEVIMYFMSPYLCSNNNQPIAIDSAVVMIYDSLYAEILTNDTTVCAGETISIEGVTDPTLSFSWEPENLVDNPNSLIVNVSPNTSTTFRLKARMDDAPATCPEKIVEYNLTIENDAEILMPEDMYVCLEDSIPIFIDIIPNIPDYILRWEPEQYLRNNYENPNMFWAPQGSYEVTVEVTSPHANCVSRESMNIHVQDKVSMNYVSPQDTTIEYGSTIQLEANSAANAIFYWDPITYLDKPTDPITNATPLEDMLYRVVSMDEFGCSDTAYVNIKVIYNSDIMIPNAFTPDGDGLNDVFRIVGHKFEKLLSFSVYNRYGQEVFYTQNITEGWDGKYNGKKADPGTYYYVIEYVLPDNEIKKVTGDVVLLR